MLHQITQTDMTHKEILTAFRNGNTKVVFTCDKSGEEIVCTIVRAGAKRIYIAYSEYFTEIYSSGGNPNWNYPMLTAIYEGA